MLVIVYYKALISLRGASGYCLNTTGNQVPRDQITENFRIWKYRCWRYNFIRCFAQLLFPRQLGRLYTGWPKKMNTGYVWTFRAELVAENASAYKTGCSGKFGERKKGDLTFSNWGTDLVGLFSPLTMYRPFNLVKMKFPLSSFP